MKFLTRFTLTIFFILFILTGTIYQIIDFSRWSNAIMIITGISILIITLLVKQKNFKFFFEWFDIIYILFVMAILISAIINSDFDILQALVKFVLYYIVLSLCVRNIPDILNPNLFFSSFLVASILLLFINLINVPDFIGVPIYRGMFDNPNSFGLFAAGLIIILIGFIFLKFSEKNIFKMFIYSTLALFSFYLMTISNSRTAFVGVILTLVLFLGIYAISMFKDGKFKITSRQIYNFVSILFLVIFLVFMLKDSPLNDALRDNIFAKFVRQESDLTSGRTEIWTFYLENSNLFSSRYNYLLSFIGVSPHNSFIMVFAQFGQIAGVLYLVLWIKTMWFLIKYSIKNYNNNKYLPFFFMSIVLFISMSFMEVLNNSVLMYAALYSISIMISQSQKKNLEQKI